MSCHNSISPHCCSRWGGLRLGHVYPPHTIKSRQTAEPYYTYRMVESIREGGRVRQRTLLNLGRHFEVPRAQWCAFVQRIEQLVGGQQDLMPADLNAQWEEAAQRYAAHLIRAPRWRKAARARGRIITASMSTAWSCCVHAA
jgi:hypothetical protein